MTKYQNRNEVPEKYKWDLTAFFKNEEDFNKSFQKLKKDIEALKKYKGCTSSADKLSEFLKFENELDAVMENLYVYSFLLDDQELGNPKSIERKTKVLDLNNEMVINTSFFAPEILSLSEESYNNLFKNERLLKYKSVLDRIYREKKHILTEREEQLISELTNSMDNYEDIWSNLVNSENDYGKITLDDNTTVNIAPNNLRSLLKNKNRKIRKKVYKLFMTKLNQYGGTCAGLLNSFVKENNSLAKIHNFDNAWSEKLFHLNIDNESFEVLINGVEKGLNSLQKYIELRKRILNVKNIYYYDLTTDLSMSNKEYTIEEAQDIVLESLKPLGSNYLNKFNTIFSNNYIDYCQYKGKCSGAYSFSTSTNPSRILMNFNDCLSSVSTIAHEGGHNVHHQYLTENNLLQYRSQSPIVCEVASLTNECLLSHYLFENGTTKEEKLAGINNIIDVIISNLFGAVREGKIEQEMYNIVVNGDCLTKEKFDEITVNSFKKYFGNSLTLDKEIKSTWIIRSHYYMKYYLYSYAISIAIATNVANRIINGDEEMQGKYLNFLQVGSDKWPNEAFEVLGFDLKDEKIYENVIDYFDKLVNDLEKLYYKEEV